MGHPLDVVVFGKGDIAIATCAWLASSRAHRLRAVVPVIPEPTWTGSLMTWADDHSVDIVPSGRWQDLEQGLKIDLGISIFCHQIFPQRFIERCGRLVNLHNSLLPKYRGMAPINWALNNGEREHGLTLHEITVDIDAGPIIDQQAYPISSAEDEVIDVYRRALLVGWTLMERNLPTLHQSPAKPQDEDQATYYSAADQARLGPRRYFRRNEHGPRD